MGDEVSEGYVLRISNVVSTDCVLRLVLRSQKVASPDWR